MPRFHYAAYNESGGRVEATLEAPDARQARRQLAANGLTATQIREVAAGPAQSGATRRSLSLQDLEFLTAELALLLRNGVRIDRALQILMRGAGTGGLGYVLNELSDEVRGGTPLSDALAQFPESFDALFINLVRVGEATGTLPSIFERLAQNLQFRKRVSQQVRQALTYPIFIMVVCVGVILFVFNFIVPRLTVMFEGVDQLPLYTEILLGVTDWVTSYQLPAGIGLALLALAARYWVRTGAGRAALWRVMQKTPLVGSQILILERLRYSAAMGLLLEQDVQLDEAMRLAAGSIQSPGLRNALEAACTAVKQGATLHTSLAQTGLFNDSLIGMIEVGEESASLNTIFDEIRQRATSDFEASVARLTTLLEPLLILLMGLIVGSVVVVMLMSIVAIEDVGF